MERLSITPILCTPRKFDPISGHLTTSINDVISNTIEADNFAIILSVAYLVMIYHNDASKGNVSLFGAESDVFAGNLNSGSISNLTCAALGRN